MIQSSSKTNVSKILSVVPAGREFRFCTADGVYTKVEAKSLEDFTDKLDGIDASAIEFHYPRGDFQAWIKDVVGDAELADRMCFVRRELSGEKLRLTLQKMLRKRIKELKELP